MPHRLPLAAVLLLAAVLAACGGVLEDRFRPASPREAYLHARITDTVRTTRKAHQHGMGISILGEDPTRTIFRWDGARGGTMLHYDAWYARIGRLTLDGAGTAAIALNYGPSFSTYNETADMVFRDVASGMVLGGGGNGQAELLAGR